MNYSFSLLNKQPQVSIPTGRLRVAPYEIEQLLEVEIRQKINEHSTLYIKGLLAKEGDGSDVGSQTEGTAVVLSAVDTSGEAFVLFQGIANRVEVQVVKKTCYVEIWAVSYSYLLDVEKKSRSFQDKSMSYSDLIRQVADAYPEAEVIDTASNGEPTNKFIVQHGETDWAFIKRLASHFHTGLICDARFDSPKFFFGIPAGQELALDSDEYAMGTDTQRFGQLAENGIEGLSKQDFTSYSVKTNYVVRIGDKVTFKQKQLCVYEAVGITEHEDLVSRLTLMQQKGLCQPYIPNSNAVGVSFRGCVTESNNDRVKVSLDIDRGHDPGAPCFFPYSTIYSSRDGSGWYCMPEIGDTVRIYCPDGEDDHAYAISSVHEEVDPARQHKADGADTPTAGGIGSYSGQRDDPGVKSLSTPNGMEVRMTADGVYVISDGATIMLQEDGVTVVSENDITFTSKKNIVMSAEQEVSVVGTMEVGLSSDAALALLKDDMQVIGQEVKAN